MYIQYIGYTRLLRLGSIEHRIDREQSHYSEEGEHYYNREGEKLPRVSNQEEDR